MSSDTEIIPCPVCSKKFFVSEIEEHANRCIFLNSENPSSNTSKRLSDQFCSPQSKRKRNVEKIQDSSDRSDLTPSMPHNSDAKENDFEDIGSRNDSIPLAEKMRPSHISNFYGQEHILGLGKALRCLMERGSVPNMILWGPPGCGKTTLAHIIAEQCKSNNERYRFVKLSATMAGTDKVKEVVKIAKNELSSFKRNTLLFLDEIHRFNKLQQDVFLPHLESGVITLIGATTENPSFSLNNALLSRCQVFTFEKLQVEDIMKILQRALSKIGAAILKPGQIVASDISDKNPWAVVQEETVRWLAEMSDGDARIALNSLQLAHRLLRGRQEPEPGAEAVALTLDDIKDCVKRSHLLYDKKGDEHYNIISAVHKSIRASDDNAALYWVTRMIQGGEDPIFIARRLVRAASEDIGLADPAALPLAVSTMQGCQLLGMPECDVLLAQCAIYLARAPKSTEAYKALGRARSAVQEHRGPQPGVPLHLRNAPTRLMRELGYGKGYNMAHRDVSNLQYMPEGLEHLNFF